MADSADSEAPTTGGKRSAWMVHVKKTMRAHPGKKLGQVLKMAAKTYKKAKKGGMSLSPASVGGPVGGRRRTRKAKKGGRKH